MAKYEPMLTLTMARKKARKTQAEFAEIVGVTKNTISAYESGQRFPRREILNRMAAALNVEPRDLI